VYEGGSLYWAESDIDSETLIYNAGRVSGARLTRNTKDEDGNDDWFRVHNTTVWLVSHLRLRNRIFCHAADVPYYDVHS